MESHNPSGKSLPTPESWAVPLDDFSAYMAFRGNSPRTIKTRRGHLSKMARDIGKEPHAITAEDLIAWASQQPWTKETRHSYYSSLHIFFTYYYNTHTLAGTNPSTVLPSVTRSLPPPRPIPEDVLEDALRHASGRDLLILQWAAFAGLRCREISQLNSKDIATVDGTATVTIIGKGNKKRMVPISAVLLNSINNTLCDADGWIFPSRYGGHLGASRISKIGNSLLPHPYTMHSLRHRYATIIYAHTHDIIVVSQLLGHSSIATTQRYTQIPNDALRDASLYAGEIHAMP